MVVEESSVVGEGLRNVVVSSESIARLSLGEQAGPVRDVKSARKAPLDRH